MRALVFIAFIALLLLVCRGTAQAHGTRAVSIDIAEVTPGTAVVHLRSTVPGTDSGGVELRWADPCRSRSDGDSGDVSTVTCPGSVAGNEVTVTGLGPILTEAILVVSLADGARATRVLTADQPSFVLPRAQTGAGVARSYVRLGVGHILTGYDHLLFLVGLVLLLRKPRAVILAETAFTLSHSLSFSATALGWIHVSAAAAEDAIALSLVLVALDIGKEGTGRRQREGVVLAFIFGLVHGLGFAGGLRDIGLPESHVPLALLGFAGGVEIGQVGFLVVALAAFTVASRRVSAAHLESGVRFGAVALGSLATYWLIDRTLQLLAPLT